LGYSIKQCSTEILWRDQDEILYRQISDVTKVFGVILESITH